MDLKLYHYWRSSSSWRIRWALSEKKIPYTPIAVNLLENEQNSKEHLLRNPSGFVPALAVDSTHTLSESSAIIEWIEETYLTPSLLPKDPFERAKSRQLAQMINAGIQPIQNLSVQRYYSDSKDEQIKWTQHFIQKGFQAFENALDTNSKQYCVGNRLSIADLFLIPQVYNANRFNVSLEAYPKIKSINDHCLTLESCKASHPDSFQPH